MSWPRKGGNLMSSGHSADGDVGKMTAALVSGLSQLWRCDTMSGAAIRAGCVVVGGYVYVGNLDGWFYKINATTGAVAGSYHLVSGAAIWSTAHVIDGFAYFGADDGYLYCVNTTTMALAWKSDKQTAAGEPVRTDPIVVDTLVFYGGGDGHARAAHISNGTQEWNKDLGASYALGLPPGIFGALTYYDSAVFAAGAGGAFRLDPATGAVLHPYAEPGVMNTGVAMATDLDGVTHLVVGGDQCGYLDFDADSGHRIWMSPGSGKVYSAAAFDAASRKIAFSEHNWSVQVHDLDTGELGWKRDATPDPVPSGAPVAGFAIVNGLLWAVWPPNDGRLGVWLVVHADGGQVTIWRVGTSTGIQGPGAKANDGWYSHPAPDNGVLYWAADNGKAYAFS